MADNENAADQAHHEPAAEVCEVGPDYQLALANERTFIAWQGAALYLLAAALAVEFVPALHVPPISGVVGITLAVAAILNAGMGLLKWKHTDQTIPSRRACASRNRDCE